MDDPKRLAVDLLTMLRSTPDDGVSELDPWQALELAISLANAVLANELDYECDNCGWVGGETETVEAEDPFARCEPGDVFSDRECPSCGALAFPREVPD